MATTTWISLHVGKDGSILKALQRTIAYVENPEKTENGMLVTGYECTPEAAAMEFAMDREQYFRNTG